MGKLQKDLPELSGVGGFGIAAAPGQSLPLNMHQASLHRNVGPQPAQNPNHRGIAINGEATWAKPTFQARLQERRQLRLRALRDTVLPGNQRMGLGIQQSNQTPWPMEECPVQNEVLDLAQVQRRLWRRLSQIVTDHSMKLARAIAALAGQLPDRIAFDKPTPEPFLLSPTLDWFVAPAERSPAADTKPPLHPISVMTVPLENSPASGAVFFCPRYISSLNRFNDYSAILRLSQS